jgi:hypothetical protein
MAHVAKRTAISALTAAVLLALAAPSADAGGRGYDERRSDDRLYFGYGGPDIWHEFARKPGERPHHRHYYPRRWGGYAFSAPYFVDKRDYQFPRYRKVPYGKAQRNRYSREVYRHLHDPRERW